MHVENLTDVSLINGTPTHKEYTHTESTVGKTVEAEAKGYVEGQYGDELCAVLLFTDGTSHAYVLQE